VAGNGQGVAAPLSSSSSFRSFLMVHALIANAPYGIVTTLAIAALSGRGAPAAGAAS